MLSSRHPDSFNVETLGHLGEMYVRDIALKYQEPADAGGTTYLEKIRHYRDDLLAEPYLEPIINIVTMTAQTAASRYPHRANDDKLERFQETFEYQIRNVTERTTALRMLEDNKADIMLWPQEYESTLRAMSDLETTDFSEPYYENMAVTYLTLSLLKADEDKDDYQDVYSYPIPFAQDDLRQVIIKRMTTDVFRL